ncbi:MAG: DegT/DnrJ/EryC1/StrS family aminotransferase [Actinomycetes bacterium]
MTSPTMTEPLAMTTAFDEIEITDADVQAVVMALTSGSNSRIGLAPESIEQLLGDRLGSRFALATSSGSNSLLAAALLLRERGAVPGSEVIVPGFAFPTTAAAFAAVGFTVVFVDIDLHSLYIDPAAVATAITDRTCTVVTLPYNGVVGDFDSVHDVARRHDLLIIEDAAQSFGARRGNQSVGALGDVGAMSFDRAKAVVGGQAGAITCRDDAIEAKLREILEYGTNRTAFLRGRVERYQWTSLGSNLVISGIDAALLRAQLTRSGPIIDARRALFDRYREALTDAASDRGWIIHQAPHGDLGGVNMFPILLTSGRENQAFTTHMGAKGIDVRDHFQPLHTSIAGLRYGRTPVPLPVTLDACRRLVRLPFHSRMLDRSADRVIDAVLDF